jgi:hypothetical protein
LDGSEKSKRSFRPDPKINLPMFIDWLQSVSGISFCVEISRDGIEELQKLCSGNSDERQPGTLLEDELRRQGERGQISSSLLMLNFFGKRLLTRCDAPFSVPFRFEAQ